MVVIPVDHDIQYSCTKFVAVKIIYILAMRVIRTTEHVDRK